MDFGRSNPSRLSTFSGFVQICSAKPDLDVDWLRAMGSDLAVADLGFSNIL